jgi:hypothetical protein
VLKSFVLTPQGSAADVAMCAMLEIDRNTRLKELGWTLLLQVFDVLWLVKCRHTLFFPLKFKRAFTFFMTDVTWPLVLHFWVKDRHSWCSQCLFQNIFLVFTLSLSLSLC